ncbi:MAG: carbamoyltransferase HypF [Candidatus Omnitrophota bacterium]|nr:MAG: carbamoyltransferase HypF [Candidatus Omnitrophota bacterium]
MKSSLIVLAAGADIKNRFLLAEGRNLRFGPDIGDLSNASNYELFKKEIRRATKNIRPDIITCDLHPGYFSTKFVKENSRPVQHHHAHIASVIEEHDLKNPVIGVAFDGTGLGTDGNIWGGEFLVVSRRGFNRLAHFKYIKMPGGDKVAGEPWRMVLSILGRRGIPFIKSVKKEDKELILSICAKNINSPLTSSSGRLFDAAAALLGICEKARHEAEGPVKLEAMCKNGVEEDYEFGISKDDGRYIIDAEPLFLGMVEDMKKRKDKKVIAAKFHNSIARIIVKTVKRLSKDTGIKDIALSGGVFQNRFLRTKTIEKLLSSKFNVFINNKTPVNDFNISLGQFHVSRRTGKN